MIDDPKKTLGFTDGQHVVDRRKEVKKYNCCTEDTRANKECSVSVPRSVHDKTWNCDECCNQRDTVADAVREFFISPSLCLAVGEGPTFRNWAGHKCNGTNLI